MCVGECQLVITATRQVGILRTTRAKIQANIATDDAQENEKKAFFVGGNSSCRVHICQHYDIYKERCKTANIPENHHAIPRHIYRQMKVSKKGEAVQSTLDGVLEKPKYAKPYTRKGVAHAVAQFVACDDQVRKIVVLCIEIDSLQPGLCAH